jgi:hypothetical protein
MRCSNCLGAHPTPSAQVQKAIIARAKCLQKRTIGKLEQAEIRRHPLIRGECLKRCSDSLGLILVSLCTMSRKARRGLNYPNTRCPSRVPVL